MTWDKWVISKYNTNGYYLDDIRLTAADGINRVCYMMDSMPWTAHANETINNNAEYVFAQDPWCML